jgi:uncharacterized protein
MSITADALPAFAAPTPAAGRLPLIDTLRAMALLGVIIMNIVGMQMAFVGDQVMANPSPPELAWASFDLIFLEGKARSCFAFLFGVGFGVMMLRAQRRGDGFGAFYVRRMGALLAFGIVNQLFLFWGDILVLYAVLGTVLLLFRGWSDRALLASALLLIIVPPLVHGALEAFSGPVPNLSGASPDADKARFDAALAAYQNGTYNLDVVRSNLSFPVGEWMNNTAYHVVYAIGVLGLFQLGLLTARHGVLFDVASYRPLLRKIAWVGFPIGLVLSVLHATINMGWQPGAPWSGAQQASYVGLPILAMAYVAMFSLLLGGGKGWIQRALAPVGRMALTNYLASGAIGALAYHAYGFGLMGKLGMIGMNGFALGIYAGLAIFSHLWLARFGQGPMEWLWRRISYGGVSVRA